MKLVVGLGNPGEKYKNTRHNVGFMALDVFASANGFSDFKKESKFEGSISEGNLKGEKVILLKPDTFMNLSGDSVSKVMNYYKLKLTDVLVIADDKDMEFGKIRYREEGGSGGHNGLKNIIKHLGDNFRRIKIGVANSNLQYKDTADFVLEDFSKAERKELDEDLLIRVMELVEERL